jgi:uncharacterized protein (TIGR03437 family)
MKPMRHFAFLSVLLLSAGFGLSLTGWQGQRAEATAKLPSSLRDAAETFTVSNANDSGDGSLRKAIQDANAMAGDDIITFATPFFSTPRTITLTSGELAINSNLIINGPGANLLTVRRADNAPDFRIFSIVGGLSNVALNGLTISNGRSPSITGGGIESQSNLTLTNVHVTGNQANNSGGGVLLSMADGTFTGCTFSGNTAGNQGGGILYRGNGGHTLRLVNSTVSGNAANNAGAGGGILHFSSSGSSRLEVVNSTIANNTSATTNGGGIFTTTFSGSGETATTTLRNSIIANNTPNNLGTAGTGATITSLGFNLSGDNSLQFINQSTDFVNTDPLLGPLQDNGGPTPTHALLFGSKALDAGHSSDAMTDQRGLPRRVDLTLANQAGGDGADIGAYELQATPAQLAISDVSKNEGNSGQTAFDFTVTLLAASTQTVTVIYLTQNDSAQSGSDYAPTEGQLTFMPGQTSQTVTVLVNGDTTMEPNETFLVNLRNATNATIADAQGLGTIVNDDQPPPPMLAINDVSKNEGNSGQTAFDFTVTLSAASGQTVTVDYLSGEGTATVGSDYTRAEGRLTFTPGQTSRTITVQVNGDTTVEPDETLMLDLRTPTNAMLADGQGMGTIVNDDVPAAQIVQNTNDSGTGSLRQVIADAPAGSSVMFSPTVFNVARTITLTSDQLLINKTLTIQGPGANLLTISGNNTFRVLRVQGSGLNVTLNDLTISNGRATGSSGGGGILSNSPLALNRCVIANNTATTDGGGVYLQAGAFGPFIASTFSGNTANNGGGIYYEGSAAQLLIINCTISGNTGTLTGGALVHFAANTSLTTILSSTIANNNSADGGGIFIHATRADVTASALTRNSIYANNINTNLRTLSENGGTAAISSLGHNLTTGGGSGLLTAPGDQINTNPLLGPLANNGGPTPTHALLFGSPALDKGNAPGIATDQRSVGRPVDDPLLLNATGGDGADIGAFERSALAMLSAASFKPAPFAPESIVALFGENLTGAAASANSVPLPLTLANTSVTVRDASNTARPAPLFFASAFQINFQLPLGTAVGAATIAVLRDGNLIASVNTTSAAVEPGLFTANANGTGAPAALLLRVKADGAQSIETVTQVQDGRLVPKPLSLGPPGEQVFLILFGTGLRNRSSLNAVTLDIGNVTGLGVDYAGPQGLIGLDQINSRALPRSLAGSGTVSVRLTVDGKAANVVTLNFQ